MREIIQYTNDDGVEIVIKKETSESLPEFYFETYFENGKAICEKQYENGVLNNVSF
jgi:antitoxin component YwqK of YwqJK toxin-antitoxin module